MVGSPGPSGLLAPLVVFRLAALLVPSSLHSLIHCHSSVFNAALLSRCLASPSPVVRSHCIPCSFPAPSSGPARYSLVPIHLSSPSSISYLLSPASCLYPPSWSFPLSPTLSSVDSYSSSQSSVTPFLGPAPLPALLLFQPCFTCWHPSSSEMSFPFPRRLIPIGSLLTLFSDGTRLSLRPPCDLVSAVLLLRPGRAVTSNSSFSHLIGSYPNSGPILFGPQLRVFPSAALPTTRYWWSIRYHLHPGTPSRRRPLSFRSSRIPFGNDWPSHPCIAFSMDHLLVVIYWVRPIVINLRGPRNHTLAPVGHPDAQRAQGSVHDRPYAGWSNRTTRADGQESERPRMAAVSHGWASGCPTVLTPCSCSDCTP